METPFRPKGPPEELPTYYENLDDDDILRSFRTLDNEKNFEFFDRQARNPLSSNFCVDFGDDDAFCAFDLGSDSYARLLSNSRPSSLHTRWINLWLPYNQKDTLHALAKHYDFSPRLLGLMCEDPIPSRENRNMRESQATLDSKKSHKSQRSRLSRGSQRTKEERLDSEESIGMTDLMHSTQLEIVRNLSHYHIVDEVWHWSTVDWGRQFVCLGYNTLHNIRTPTTTTAHSDETDNLQDIPHGKRVWNWLLLTEDKTVISISEDPFPFSDGNLRPGELRTLYTTRRNIVSILRQLTKVPTPLRDFSLQKLSLRHRIGNSDKETAHRPTDTPGLLFYYLFEDWYTTYNLITRNNHGYAAELDRLRREMLVCANLEHIDRLHHIGCQLAVLKRVYQSYEKIIERVLKKQEATIASLKNSYIVSGVDSIASSYKQEYKIPEADSLLGVSLSSAARARFERLKDRIMLYALSEIQECIDQKDSLVMMNFNLIAIKESFSVERLTRVALLLAKITIVFMPVTLMTGYFSIQFAGLEFTVKSYWWAFAVVLGISLFATFVFSVFSGTFEGKIITRTWSRTFFDFSRGWLKHQRHKGRGLE